MTAMRTGLLGTDGTKLVLWGQFPSEEPQNCVECLAKEIHEDAASCPHRA